MEEGEVTLESELSNWFDDYADEKLIKNAAKAVEERVIKRHYIKKEDVLEAIGEDDWLSEEAEKLGHYPDTLYTRNKLRAAIKSKLNLGDK